MTRLFNDTQEQFIRENVVGLGNQELADLINKEFGLSITRAQMKGWKSNRRISSGLTGRFNKGHEPINKGTKGLFNVGGNKTSFKPGQRPHNFKPIGSTRIDRDGYTLIKVSDEGSWHRRWRFKHKVVWEKVYGTIPKGHVLIFLDGNKQNICLDNLKLITNRQLLAINRNGWKFDNKELTETGLLLADLNINMHKKLKGSDKK